jgi:hypothetical protein
MEVGKKEGVRADLPARGRRIKRTTTQNKKGNGDGRRKADLENSAFATIAGSIAHPPSNELFSEIAIRIKFQTFSLAKLDRDFFAASRARTMARRTFTSSSPTLSLTNHSTDWRISKPAPRRFFMIAKLLRFSLGLLFSRFRGAASQWCASRSSCGVPVRTRL